MNEKNSIKFVADYPEEISKARTNLQLALATGKADIKINNINMTERVGDDRIIEFASVWLEKTPEILSGKETVVKHGDDPWNFVFKREQNDGDFVNCSLKFNNDFERIDLKYPTRDYCIDLLQASSELGEIMEQNELKRIFKIYNTFNTYMVGAANVMIKEDILTKQYIEKIYSKKNVIDVSETRER